MRPAYSRFKSIVFLVVFLIVSISTWSTCSSLKVPKYTRQTLSHFRRGGSLSDQDEQADSEVDVDPEEGEEAKAQAEIQTPLTTTTIPEAKHRHASDILLDLITRSSVDRNAESRDLRALITQRTENYLMDLDDHNNKEDFGSENHRPPPDPRKLLHYLAPKIFAIQHSPDVALRIQSARGDVDSGVASCLIGTTANVCEIYDNFVSEMKQPKSNGKQQRRQQQHRLRSSDSSARNVIKERRFEQVVECVLCGVDVKKRRKEFLRQQLDRRDAEPEDIEEILDGEHAQMDEGLSVRDSCRAAWGLSILGVHECGSMGGENVMDILMALSLRSRELLLARLELLRRLDFFGDENESLTVEERLREASEEIAEDAASAMWSFACVRACTGMRSASLFDVCCNILCQDPVAMRQRAQEEDATFGASAVIDRLEKSEHTDSLDSNSNSAQDVACSEQWSEGKGFIDWLSPNEVTDVLWALALHGSNVNAVSRDEISLSGTVAAFREVAFDRLVEWLQAELASVQMLHQQMVEQRAVEETMTVEVVDAAKLLASEYAGDTDSLADAVENMTVRTEGSVQQVQVINAETILSAAAAEEETRLDTEAGPSDEAPESRNLLSNVDNSLRSPSILKYFSPHDLSSIAWAVTELRDPLRHIIMDLVDRIFVHIGPRSLQGLSGGDLSNLAWAMARYAQDVENAQDSATLVTTWIADEVMTDAHRPSTTLHSAGERLLQRFQPLELSRLAWAVASNLRAQVTEEDSITEAARKLGGIVLTTASLNLPLFGTEDLARIAWAYLELSDLSTITQPPELEALGRILSAIESALSLWEGGAAAASRKEDDNDSKNSRESTRFASFFGRTRFHLPFLDHKLDESAEDIDEQPGPSLLEKSSLPLLRDLPIDPSTLCKVACSFSRVARSHRAIRGSESLARVALRLLTSRGGRLLRECPFHDLVRLCETVVTADSSSGREMISFFVRRLVQFLNEASESSSNPLSLARIKDIASLVWALGELGVKYCPGNGEVPSAYRRLQLVAKIPSMDKERILLLPNSYLVKLLRGVVSMNVVSTDAQCLLDILECLKTNLPSIKDRSELCELVESLGVLKASLGDVEGDSTVIALQGSNQTEAGNVTSDDSFGEQKSLSVVARATCDVLLAESGNQAAGLVETMELSELRRLLSVYAGIPFQADQLINVIDADLSRRYEQLESNGTCGSSFRDLLVSAGSSATVAKNWMSEENDGSSPFAAIRKGLSSLFRQPENNGGRSLGEESPTDSTYSRTEEEGLQRKVVLQGIDSMIGASALLQNLENGCRVSVDTALRELERGALFELGRCHELIEHYRRTDFATGSRQSRFDGELRRDMAKRVLSRLLPYR